MGIHATVNYTNNLIASLNLNDNALFYGRLTAPTAAPGTYNNQIATAKFIGTGIYNISGPPLRTPPAILAERQSSDLAIPALAFNNYTRVPFGTAYNEISRNANRTWIYNSIGTPGWFANATGVERQYLVSWQITVSQLNPGTWCDTVLFKRNANAQVVSTSRTIRSANNLGGAVMNNSAIITLGPGEFCYLGVNAGDAGVLSGDFPGYSTRFNYISFTHLGATVNNTNVRPINGGTYALAVNSFNVPYMKAV